MARTHENRTHEDLRAADKRSEVLRRAAAYGIDLSLLAANLALSPTERIEKLTGWVEVATELRRAVAQRTAAIEPGSNDP